MTRDKHISILFHKAPLETSEAQLVDILCYILLILGVFGNVLGLFTFSSSRRSWRISSTYVYLATSSSIINLLCVVRYVLILHSKSQNMLHELVGQKWWACKLYEFSFSFRVISSYITLFWMLERLTCVSEKLRLFFDRWISPKFKYIISITITVILLSFIVGPPVYMFEPRTINYDIISSARDITKMYCELSSKASDYWQRYFHEIRFGFNHFTIRCIFSELAPSVITVLFNSYITYYLIRANYDIHKTNRGNLRKQRTRTIRWMNIVLTLHSFLFLASLFCHLAGHIAIVEAHETWWVLLSILINCSLNFYLYCLSGKAFRREIYRFILRLKIILCEKLQTYCRRRRRRRYQSLSYEMNNLEPIGKHRVNQVQATDRLFL